jgi:hypothetical protein
MKHETGCRPSVLARAVLRSGACGDEVRGRFIIDVSGMPNPRRINRVFARAERDRRNTSIGLFLVSCHGAGQAQHDLAAARMHLPHPP